MSTNLREATAIISAEGLLAEKNLKEEIVANGVRVISGSVTIKISDTDTIQFYVKQASNKSDGHGGYTADTNSVFAGIETVLKEFKSIADFGEAEADRVRVTRGQIRPYYSTKSNREIMNYQSSFFNRITADENSESYARFEVEVFISSIVPEMYTSGEHQGDETGRVVVKGWMPTYNGIEPLELIAPKEDDIASAILDAYQPKQTVTFYGDVINRKVVKTKTTPVKIGKPKVETTATYTNELIITGATEAYEDDAPANESPFNADAVAQAVHDRETRIAEQKEKDKNGGASRSFNNKPASSGRNLPW